MYNRWFQAQEWRFFVVKTTNLNLYSALNQRRLPALVAGEAGGRKNVRIQMPDESDYSFRPISALSGVVRKPKSNRKTSGASFSDGGGSVTGRVTTVSRIAWRAKGDIPGSLTAPSPGIFSI